MIGQFKYLYRVKMTDLDFLEATSNNILIKILTRSLRVKFIVTIAILRDYLRRI